MPAKHKDLPLDEFTIIIEPPERRASGTCINIHEDGRFNLNGQLSKVLAGKALGLRFSGNAQYLCLIDDKTNEQLIHFPKSGSKLLPSVSKFLKKHSISFPAQYEMWYSDESRCWQGVHIENPTIRLSKRPRNS